MVALLVDAPEYWGIMGRATGKSAMIMAPRIARRIVEMPRSKRILIAATFQQTLTRTLPGIVQGLEMLGYKLNVHFLIGQKPTAKWIRQWNWRGPYQQVFKYENTIVWWNGAVQQLISQDNIGSTNGLSIDGIDGDEAKYLNQERFQTETLPANRGIIREFANNPHHHGMTFTTDMPVGTGGRWILDKEKGCDKNRVNELIRLSTARNMLALRMKSESTRRLYSKQIELLDWKMNELKKDSGNQLSLVHFQQASTLENIHSLGIKYIRSQMKGLSKFEFSAYILNRKPGRMEDGFYPDLDEEKHGYFAYDYHVFYNTGYKFDELKDKDGAAVDADYNPNKPLHIALDYNRAICPIVVGQINSNEIRLINGMHCLYPKKLRDTLKSFCEYYRLHKKKVLYYWFDHTAVGEYAHAGKQCDEVMNYLRKEGWVVIERYIGQALGHERRYTMYGHLLTEDEYYPYKLRFNRERCKYLLLSMNQAEAEQKKQGFGKSKKSELDKNFPQEESTHYSEALDMMVGGLCESGLNVIEVVEDQGMGLDFL